MFAIRQEEFVMQDRDTRLKRCSCGSLPQIYETKYGDWYVACPVCSKRPIPTYFTRKDAIKAWNNDQRYFKNGGDVQ